MVIEEFIATYADSEMAKIAKMTDAQLAALASDTKESNVSLNPNAKLSMYRTRTEALKSPHATSKTLFKGDGRINGTNRGKSMTVKQ